MLLLKSGCHQQEGLAAMPRPLYSPTSKASLCMLSCRYLSPEGPSGWPMLQGPAGSSLWSFLDAVHQLEDALELPSM